MRHLPLFRLICIAFLACLLVVAPVVAQEYQYQEQKGKEIIPVTVTREKQGKLMRSEIARKGGTEISFNDVGKLGATSRWQLEAGTDKSYAASRELNILTITGKAAGEPHENAAGLDDKPWLQDLGYALAKFVATPHRDLAFWTIKEGELEPTVLTAKKRGAETLLWNGQSISVQKIEVRSNDFFSKLWSAVYWFRESDGVLVQYRSDPGIPGMSETVGTLVETENPTK